MTREEATLEALMYMGEYGEPYTVYPNPYIMGDGGVSENWCIGLVGSSYDNGGFIPSRSDLGELDIKKLDDYLERIK